MSSFHSWLVPSTSIVGCPLCVSCAPGMPHQDSVLLDGHGAPISRSREKKRPLPFLLEVGDKLWGATRNSRSQASIPGHSLENLEFWLPRLEVSNFLLLQTGIVTLVGPPLPMSPQSRYLTLLPPILWAGGVGGERRFNVRYIAWAPFC